MISISPTLYFVFGFIACFLCAWLLTYIGDDYDDDLEEYYKEDDWDDFSKKEKKEQHK